MTWRYVPEPVARGRARSRVDWRGTGAPDPGHRRAPDHAGAGRAQGLVRVAGDHRRGASSPRSALVAFIWHELRTEDPIVNLRILAQPPARRRRDLRGDPGLRALLQRVRAAGVPPEPARLHRLGHRQGDPSRRHRQRVHHGVDGSAERQGRRAGPHHRPACCCSSGRCGCTTTSPSTIGMHDLFWPMILRGVGLGFIFVPLTGAAVADLAPDAASPRAPGCSTCRASSAAASASPSRPHCSRRFTEQSRGGAAASPLRLGSPATQSGWSRPPRGCSASAARWPRPSQRPTALLEARSGTAGVGGGVREGLPDHGRHLLRWRFPSCSSSAPDAPGEPAAGRRLTDGRPSALARRTLSGVTFQRKLLLGFSLMVLPALLVGRRGHPQQRARAAGAHRRWARAWPALAPTPSSRPPCSTRPSSSGAT